jgi:hypothetical protein
MMPPIYCYPVKLNYSPISLFVLPAFLIVSTAAILVAPCSPAITNTPYCIYYHTIEDILLLPIFQGSVHKPIESCNVDSNIFIYS